MREEQDGPDRVQAAREFTQEMESRLNLFIESEEQELALEPMNSFKRRIVHTLAKAYQITSESRGEERDRHIYLIKTADSAVPTEPLPEIEIEDRPPPPRGDRPDRPARSDRPERGRGRDRGDRDRGRDRGGRDRDRSLARDSGRGWDYGAQIFTVKPGPDGIHIALKQDGSIELFREEEKAYMVFDRVVTTRQFRVREGKIVQPGEPGW
jgi:hypothetical protein